MRAATLLAVLLAACSPGDDPADRPAEPSAPSDPTAAPAVAPALDGLPDSAAVARDVSTMLQRSAAAWNGGDLEGFLDDYSRLPDLTFVGSEGVTRGLDEVRDRYRDSYWAVDVQRDSLRFGDVEVRPLGEDHALALGRWILYRPVGAAAVGDSVTSQGYFSLVLRREGDVWRILHDHSS